MRFNSLSALSLPAFRFFLVFASGILAAWHFSTRADAIWYCLIAAVVCATLLRFNRSRLNRPRPSELPLQLFLHLAIFLTGWQIAATHLQAVDCRLLSYADSGEKLRILGTVEGTPRFKRGRFVFQLRTEALYLDQKVLTIDSRTLVYYSLSSFDKDDRLQQIRDGDTVLLEGKLRSAREARNPGGFDYRAYLRVQGLATSVSASKGKALRILAEREAQPFPALITAIRSFMKRGIARLFSGDNRDIMAGLLLGERGMIREEINDELRDAGVIHILAVSGLHVGILLTMIFVPLERLKLPVRVVVAVALLWLYALLTGLAPPVTRAVLMATVLMSGLCLQRISRAENALAVAGIVILLVDPLSLLQVGFQLSFLAVFSILMFQRRLTDGLKRRLPWLFRGFLLPSLLSLFILTLSAQLGTLPLLGLYFGQVSLVSFLANLIAVPLVFVAVSSGLLAVLLSTSGGFPSTALAATASASLDIITYSSAYLASFDWAVIHLEQLPSWTYVLYVVLLMAAFRKKSRILNRLVIIALILGAVFTVLQVIETNELSGATDQPARKSLRVTFIDVGQGDAALVEFPDGRDMLIDAGARSSRHDVGARTVVPYLRSRGIDRLSALVLTHPDNDHIGGAASVLNELEVDRIYYSYDWPDKKLALLIDSLMDAERAALKDVRAGDVISFGEEIRLYVLSPRVDDHDEKASNNSSTVLMLVYGQTSFLFTGDAETAAEREMIKRYGDFLRADVLKVGHHGSTTSTSPAFALAVRPRHAVISCGRNNRFNHPRQEILTRLDKVGAQIHRTDLEGAVIFESDGDTIRKINWQK